LNAQWVNIIVFERACAVPAEKHETAPYHERKASRERDRWWLMATKADAWGDDDGYRLAFPIPSTSTLATGCGFTEHCSVIHSNAWVTKSA